MLPALEAIQVIGDSTVIDKRSNGTARFGGEVEEVQCLALSSSNDRKRAVWWDESGKAVEECASFGVRVAGDVEELESEQQDVGERSLFDVPDRLQAVPRGRGEPRVILDVLVRSGGPMSLGCDGRGDLQGRRMRVRLCPEGCTAAGVAEGQRERQATIRQRYGLEPVEKGDRVGRGRRGSR